MTKRIEIYVESLAGELWRVVNGYDNYFVSNYGRVYGMYQKKVLKHFNSGGKPYVYVKLCKQGVPHSIAVHRLIATAFCDNTESKPIVHHKDTNAKNNYADNLMWVTKQEHKNLHKQIRAKRKGATNE